MVGETCPGFTAPDLSSGFAQMANVKPTTTLSITAGNCVQLPLKWKTIFTCRVICVCAINGGSRNKLQLINN